jgi:hypothetical protein
VSLYYEARYYSVGAGLAPPEWLMNNTLRIRLPFFLDAAFIPRLTILEARYYWIEHQMVLWLAYESNTLLTRLPPSLDTASTTGLNDWATLVSELGRTLEIASRAQ